MDGMLFVHQSCTSSFENGAKEVGVLQIVTFIASAMAISALATASEVNLVVMSFSIGLTLFSCYLNLQFLRDSRSSR